MEAKIKITCDGCMATYDVNRDADAPKSAISMGCNWCPKCEDKADDYYSEWYNYNDGGGSDDNDPNQLMLFSVSDDIVVEQKEAEATNLTL